MPHKIITVSATVCLAAATALVPSAPASATQALTVSGPSTAAYNTTVTLSGTAPTAKLRVTLHVEQSPATAYHVVGVATSDSSGHVSFPLALYATTKYYVATSTQTSAVHSITVALASCKDDGTAFTTLLGKPESGEYPSASLTVEAGGLWAGYEWDPYNYRFSVITWKQGETKPTVLDTIGATNMPGGPAPIGFGADEPPSVQAVGITPAGGVVVSATQQYAADYRTHGYVYLGGKRYALATAPSWTSERPLGVTPSGTIVGVVRTGLERTGTYYLAQWNSTGGAAKTLLTLPTRLTSWVMDTAGDVAFPASSSSLDVRLAATGKVVALGTSPGGSEGNLVDAGAGASFYGVDGQDLTSRWTVGTSSVPFTGTLGEDEPLSASPRSDIVVIDPSNAHNADLITYDGKFTPLPTQGVTTVSSEYGSDDYVAPYGVVTYTGDKDRLVHFVSCS